MLSMLGKIFSRRHIEIFFLCSSAGFDILCKLSPMETICIKYQTLFSGEKKRKQNIINLSAAEFAQGAVKDNIDWLQSPVTKYFSHIPV